MNIWTLLMDNLRRGAVTVRFPARPPASNRYRGLVQINTEPCKCCGICALVCTSSAISMKKADGHYEWNYDPGQCTFCGRCVDACALKLLTMLAEAPPVYEVSGTLRQNHVWAAKPPAPKPSAKPAEGTESGSQQEVSR